LQVGGVRRLIVNLAPEPHGAGVNLGAGQAQRAGRGLDFGLDYTGGQVVDLLVQFGDFAQGQVEGAQRFLADIDAGLALALGRNAPNEAPATGNAPSNAG
jgi:hypothetical protein